MKKKNNNKFNLLENADERTLERMSENYSATDKKSYNRMFEMSERKYEVMKNNANIENTENTVNGVEKYNRPKWYKPMYTAVACLVAVIGVTGSLMIIKNLGNNVPYDDNNVPPVINDSPALTVETTTVTNDSAVSTITQTALLTTTVSADTSTNTQTTENTNPVSTTQISSSTTQITKSTAKTTLTTEITATTVTTNVNTETVTTENTTAYISYSDDPASYLEGYWLSSADSNGSRSIYRLEKIDDNTVSGGKINADYGLSTGCEIDIDGFNLVLHLGGIEDNTPAQILIPDIYGDNALDSFTLIWEDGSYTALSRISESEYDTIMTSAKANLESLSKDLNSYADDPVSCLEGYWLGSNSNDSRSLFKFEKYDNDNTTMHGTRLSAEYGIGVGFDVDINVFELIFHFASVEDNTPARVTKVDGDKASNGLTLTWSDGSYTTLSRLSKSEYDAIDISAKLNLDSEYLLKDLDTIDKMGGGAGIDYDENDSPIYDDNGNIKYAKVTDERFSSTNDIKNFIEWRLTDDVITERYLGILDTENPRFIDYNGYLYIDISRPVGCGFSWTETYEFTDIYDYSFSVIKGYNDYGTESKMKVDFVYEEHWKICGISLNVD